LKLNCKLHIAKLGKMKCFCRPHWKSWIYRIEAKTRLSFIRIYDVISSWGMPAILF